MAIPVTKAPLKPGEGKSIYMSYEELVRIDDALCLYLSNDNGDARPDIPPETAKAVRHIIDKINRHI